MIRLPNGTLVVKTKDEVLALANSMKCTENLEKRIKPEEFQPKFMKTDLRTYTVEIEGQEPRELKREILQTRPATVVMPITDKGNVIIVIQPRAYKATGSIELPAGYNDPIAGNSDIVEDSLVTGKRELIEETGYVPKTLEKLGTHQQDQGKFTTSNYSVLALGCNPTSEQSLDKDEIIIQVECPYSVVLELMQEEYISDSNSIIAIMKSTNRIKEYINEIKTKQKDYEPEL